MTILILKKLMGNFEMMITYHSHMKNTNNLKFVVVEIFRILKYNFKMFKFQESFAACKWVIMCMAYEQSCGL
jgi:hypothetical protein